MLVHRMSSAQHVQCVKTLQLVHLRFVSFSLCILQEVQLDGKQACTAICSCWNGTAECPGKTTGMVTWKVGFWQDKKKNFFLKTCVRKLNSTEIEFLTQGLGYQS